MLDDNQRLLFTVTDLKQYLYCARIAYYHACLPHIRPVTFKMQAGIRRHEDEHKRSIRRTMRLPEIDHAERIFDVSLQSETLGLSGQVDELLLLPDGVIPVDYKLAKKAGQHYKVQLAAYAMMAEETYQLPVKTGILYLISKREAVTISITTRLRNSVIAAIAKMRLIAENETMPLPTDQRQRCTDCEFQRFCNDI